MPSYKFKVHDVSIGSEKHGAAVLADDDEAREFAQRVIRELVRSDAIYTSGTVEITTGKRNVACITFESALNAARP
jgi:hypothetical protein